MKPSTPIAAAIRPFPVEDAGEPDTNLKHALEAARERGRLRAAEVLSGDDMVSAAELARILGAPRKTVNTKRKNGQILGLDGATRGFRFPLWQLDAEGRPYLELPQLHERLGGRGRSIAPWSNPMANWTASRDARRSNGGGGARPWRPPTASREETFSKGQARAAAVVWCVTSEHRTVPWRSRPQWTSSDA